MSNSVDEIILVKELSSVRLFNSFLGYFKKLSEKVEKDELFRLLEEYRTGASDQSSIIHYIHTLLEKYPNNYLQQSTLITGEQDEIMA